jgi:flagellar hook-basal body complex protein FliE
MIPLIAAAAGVLSALSSIKNLADSPPAAAAAHGTPVAPFSDALKTALDRVDAAISQANEKTKAFASGDQSISLSDVMISLEQANLALQAAAVVRDKVIAAYTNIMNMPV